MNQLSCSVLQREMNQYKWCSSDNLGWFNDPWYYSLSFKHTTTFAPSSSHHPISLFSSTPFSPSRFPSRENLPSAMCIHTSARVPRGALNTFWSFRRKRRRGADGRIRIVVWETVGILWDADNKGGADESMASISERFLGLSESEWELRGDCVPMRWLLSLSSFAESDTEISGVPWTNQGAQPDVSIQSD